MEWERCFLPMLLYIGTGPAGLGRCGGVGRGEKGYAFALRKSRCLAKLLHSDNLPEYTQIREEATGEKRKGTKGCSERPKSNPGPVNSHTNSAQAHPTPPQMKLTAKTKLRTRPVPHFKAFDQQFLRTKHSERLIKSVR